MNRSAPELAGISHRIDASLAVDRICSRAAVDDVVLIISGNRVVVLRTNHILDIAQRVLLHRRRQRRIGLAAELEIG